MRLTIIGATGRIGRALVQQGLREGHHVTAVVRDPARLPVSGDRLDVRVADVFEPEALRPAVKGADAVLSALGPRSMSAFTDNVNSAGIRSTIGAMRAAEVSRLIVVSAAPVPSRDPGDGLLFRLTIRPLLWALLGRHYRDLAAMEERVRASGLRWTIMRPPKLVDEPGNGEYRTAYGRNVGTIMSHADVADAMLRALADERSVGTAIGVGR